MPAVWISTGTGMPYGRQIGSGRVVSIYVPITAGEAAFSEPETQALRDFLLNNRVDALISYHSAMSAIFAAGVLNQMPPRTAWRAALSQVSFLPLPARE